MIGVEVVCGYVMQVGVGVGVGVVEKVLAEDD